MDKEFIPYNIALALKELGFDEDCFAVIDQIGYIAIVGTKSFPRGSMMYDTTLCPLYQQAFRWFREKYRLHGYSEYLMNEYYCFIIDDMKGNKDSRRLFTEYATYEEAELACLDKLIEIVKNKQNEKI